MCEIANTERGKDGKYQIELMECDERSLEISRAIKLG